jgi:hypothetical protein
MMYNLPNPNQTKLINYEDYVWYHILIFCTLLSIYYCQNYLFKYIYNVLTLTKVQMTILKIKEPTF